MPHPTILLLNPNRMKPGIAPLGLELLAARLKQLHLEPLLLDLCWEKAPLAALAAALHQHRPHTVGISVRNLDDCYYASQAFLLPPIRQYVRLIKKLSPHTRVILGGVGFSIAPQATLAYTTADLGLRGDAEDSLPLLLHCLAQNKPLKNIPGLVLPGAPQPPPASFSAYEHWTPTRGFIALHRYFRLGGQGSLETQRGCNRKCIYCADPVAKGRTPRFRHPESVVEEMARLLALDIHTFHLSDSEFNLRRSHAETVAHAIIRAGLASKIKWYAYALPEPMDPDLAQLLAAAGCAGLDFSVDAAQEDILAALGRDFTCEDLERCAKAMRKARIPFMFDLLLGGPGETTKTMATTIRRMKKFRPDRVGVSFGVRVFPGTPLARQIVQEAPLEIHPGLHGARRNNSSLLRPLFYISPALGPEPEAELHRLIAGDRRFFFASRSELKCNYNYNNNRPLCAAIRAGARGAYWDILRQMS